MAISRWCAAEEQEIWTLLGLNGEPDVDFAVDQHKRCQFEWRKGHYGHEDCCWNDDEREARLCECGCHEQQRRVEAAQDQ